MLSQDVRRSAVECLAVLSHLLGPGNQQPLVAAVDNVELSDGGRGEGATAAVQARLVRRRLSTVTEDGLVRYVELCGGDDDGRLAADVAWVELAGSELVRSASSTPGSAGRNSSAPRRTSSSRKNLNDVVWERRTYEVRR